MLRNELPLGLITPAECLNHIGVTHHPLHGIILDIAISAEDLDRILGHLHGHIRGEVFRHGGMHFIVFDLSIDHTRGFIDQCPGGLGLGGHVGEHKPEALKLGNGPSKLLAFLRILGRVIEGPLGDSNRLGADGGPDHVENLDCCGPSLSPGSQKVFLGNLTTIEDEIGRGRPAHPQFFRIFLEAEARGLFLQEKGRNPFKSLFRVRGGEDRIEVRNPPVGDEKLLSVEDEGVSLILEGGLYGVRIVAILRFRQGEGGQAIFLGDAVKILLLLLLASLQ